ncbi:hypothetical protein C8054_04285 [Micromonospora sp. RP3T]|nr:hypothetical protein C8054_04285 [Micromonospora sp. RP3T]
MLVSGGSPELSTVYTMVWNHTASTPDSGATTSPAGPGAVSPYRAIRRGSGVPGRSAAHGDTGCRRIHRCWRPSDTARASSTGASTNMAYPAIPRMATTTVRNVTRPG